MHPVLIGGPLDGQAAPAMPDTQDIVFGTPSPTPALDDSAPSSALNVRRDVYTTRRFVAGGPHPCIAGLTITLATDMYVHVDTRNPTAPPRTRAEYCAVGDDLHVLAAAIRRWRAAGLPGTPPAPLAPLVPSPRLWH